jgi:hypothetical protein
MCRTTQLLFVFRNLLQPHLPSHAINHFRVAGDDFARVRRELFHRVVLRAVMLGFDLIQVIVVIADPWS